MAGPPSAEPVPGWMERDIETARPQLWMESPSTVLRSRAEDADETEMFSVKMGRPGNRLAMGTGAMLGGHWQSQRIQAFNHSILGNTTYAKLPRGKSKREFHRQVHRKHSAADPKPLDELRQVAHTRVGDATNKLGAVSSPLRSAAGAALDMSKLAYFTQTFTPQTAGFRDVLRQGKVDPNCSVHDFRTRQLGAEPVHEGRLVTDATRYREHTLRNPAPLRAPRFDSTNRYDTYAASGSRVRLL